MFKTCVHLEALETALLAKGIAIGEPVTSPYGSEWGLWSWCNVCFDGPAVRAELSLPDFITYEEYDGRVAGSDATFYCSQCKRAIMGVHPNYATPTTPRLP